MVGQHRRCRRFAVADGALPCMSEATQLVMENPRSYKLGHDIKYPLLHLFRYLTFILRNYFGGSDVVFIMDASYDDMQLEMLRVMK